MPKLTRQLIIPLPHGAHSGLFRLASGEYVADIKPDDGPRTRRNFGDSRDRALVQFDKLLSDLATRREASENPVVVDFLTATFLPTQTSLKNYRFAAARISAACRFLDSEHPGLRLHDVRKLHGDGLLAFYRDLAPKTSSDNLQKLRQALNHAVDLDLLPANPLARCKSPRFDNRRLHVPSMEEVVRLVAVAEDECRSEDLPDIIRVLALTGLRPSNVFALHRDEVEGDLIRIPPEKMKNGRWGVVPVCSHVATLLAARCGEPFFFPSRDIAEKPRTSIKKAWANARRLAGLDWMQVYDLRHFFASQLAKQGATEQQIGRLLCHVGQSVTSRYVHQDIEDLRPFVEELSRRCIDGAV